MEDRFKFRVWDIQEKRYADLTREDVKFFITPQGELCRAIIYEDGATLLTYPEKFYKVEFCTGLKDKNGKLIYEGDILIGDKDVLWVVYWDKYEWSIKRTPTIKNWNWNKWHLARHDLDYVVIGNLHENS